MGWAMHILGVLTRNRRTKLKKDHVELEVTKEQLLAKTPPRVMEDQWPEMVNYWFHEKTMAKATRAPVERANVYLKVYRRRDGTAVTPRVQENIVFGPKRPGRVRGVGFGITPSGRSATNGSQFTSTPSLPSYTTQRISELENNFSRLTEQLAQVIGCTMMLTGNWLMTYHVLADNFL
ncbi:hypothetical protein SO802_023212 [Lithocarpus litseifolius]|uniref:Uncharacterized protein n=1 Tax=Lithocarpus litseifolius TaxID=425828 RepID=A0AAW2C8Q7_9ROSI